MSDARLEAIGLSPGEIAALNAWMVEQGQRDRELRLRAWEAAANWYLP